MFCTGIFRILYIYTIPAGIEDDPLPESNSSIVSNSPKKKIEISDLYGFKKLYTLIRCWDRTSTGTGTYLVPVVHVPVPVLVLVQIVLI